MASASDLLWAPERLVAERKRGNVRILDVRAGERYATGHVPGAGHFSLYGLNTYDTDEAPLASFVHMWAFVLGRTGVARDDRVVFYEDDTGMTAARGFWFLEYLGHENVHVLDGGLRAWVDAGGDVSRDAAAPSPVSYPYERRAERVATYREMLDAIGEPGKVILDTRGDGEWFGTERHAKRNGTIPSAVHLEWTRLVTSNGRLRPPEELEALFAARGVTRDKEVLAFCNTGYRSAHAYLALRRLGYPKVRNYVGSWQEWGNRDGLPVVVPENADRAPSSYNE